MGLWGPGRLERVEGQPLAPLLSEERQRYRTSAPPRATLISAFSFVLPPDLCLRGRSAGRQWEGLGCEPELTLAKRER